MPVSHHNSATTARRLSKEATAEAKGNKFLFEFSFDMAKTQPLPKLNTSVVFYSRQLWIYNLGINTFHNNHGIMSMWTEAKRGSREICSCIFEFLSTVDLSGKRTIRTFSDCCGGQNRNKNVICFFMYMCEKPEIQEWEHIYQESGHSYLPNDRDFAAIEKKTRGTIVVNSKEDWFKLVEGAMKKQPLKTKYVGKCTTSKRWKINASITRRDLQSQAHLIS